MKINLYDPALENKAGHHFDIDYRVTKRLVEMGHDVHVYSNRAIQPDVKRAIEALAPLTPCFSFSPYIPPLRFDPVAGSHLLFQDTSTSIARELAQTQAADLWLWPTIFAAQLNACARISNPPPISACVHVEPGEGHGQLRDLWRLAFINAKRAGLKLKIGAIEQELVYLYSDLLVDGEFHLFPVPHDGWPLAEPKKKCERIGFFGHQRNEKGSLPLINEVATELLKRGFKVVLQNSAGKINGMPGVETLGFVENLSEEIAKCDLIVLPYDPAAYRFKGSGIMWEAVATGVPVAVTKGTAPGRIASKNQSAGLFARVSSQAIINCILECRDHYQSLSDRAYLAAQRWKKNDGTEAFLEIMTEFVS